MAVRHAGNVHKERRIASTQESEGGSIARHCSVAKLSCAHRHQKYA